MTTRRAAWRLLSAALPALLAGCTYEYNNPAEDLGTGEVAGRVVADTGGTISPLAGVTVEVKGTDSLVWATTRESGRYFLFGLQPGRHTVLFREPTAGLSLQRDVEVVWGSDGQPEGVVLPDLTLLRAVTLRGTVPGPGSFTDYSSFTPSWGQVVDEATGDSYPVYTFTGANGGFDFTLDGVPTGPHRLRVAVTGTLNVWDPVLGYPYEVASGPGTLVGGPLALDIPDSSQGLKLDLTDLPLALPTPSSQGKLRFQAAVVGASSAGAFTASVTNQAPPYTTYAPAADSTGTYEVDLPPGLYSVSLAAPAGTSLIPPPQGMGVVVETQTTELGTFYAVDTAVAAAAYGACLYDADCAGAACVDGRCGTAACLAGDFSSECLYYASQCSSGGGLTHCAGGKGACAGSGEIPAVTTVCVPANSTSCVQNGVTWSLPAGCTSPTGPN